MLISAREYTSSDLMTLAALSKTSQVNMSTMQYLLLLFDCQTDSDLNKVKGLNKTCHSSEGG